MKTLTLLLLLSSSLFGEQTLAHYRNILLRQPDHSEAQVGFLRVLDVQKKEVTPPSSSHLVLGMGTGRCGTTSLTILLRHQDDCFAAHESPPIVQWECGKRRIAFHRARFNRLLEMHPVVGAVAHWWLPYFEQIKAWYPNVRAVVMKRDRAQTVRSYDTITGPLNHWIIGAGRPSLWDDCYPHFDAKTKQEAIGMYWDLYYTQAEALVKKYPEHIRIYAMEDLNSEEKQKEMLTFLGFKTPKTLSQVHYNSAKKRDGQALY